MMHNLSCIKTEYSRNIVRYLDYINMLIISYLYRENPWVFKELSLALQRKLTENGNELFHIKRGRNRKAGRTSCPKIMRYDAG